MPIDQVEFNVDLCLELQFMKLKLVKYKYQVMLSSHWRSCITPISYNKVIGCLPLGLI